MARGWRISFVEDGQRRLFLVGVADREAAIQKVTGNRRGVSDIGAEPMDQDQVKKLALEDGRVIEGSEQN